MAHRTRSLARVVLASLIIAGASPAWAVDGVVLIDQNRALAGSVTPGDTPGFPVTISLSGSYRLSGNLTVPNENTTAIDIGIFVEQVSIDLNGFSIIGPTICDANVPPICGPVAASPILFGAGTGILSMASGSVTVRNGTIRGMGNRALVSAGAALVLVELVQVRHSGRGGVVFASGNIYNSVISNTGGEGLSLDRGVVKGNQITGNGGDGVVGGVFGFINVLDNVIVQNGDRGIHFGFFGGAYGHNVLAGNVTAEVDGNGVQVSGNVCNGAPCP